MRRLNDPTHERQTTLEAILKALKGGLSLRKAAREAWGVHAANCGLLVVCKRFDISAHAD